MNVILGAAQLGMNYGVANSKGQLSNRSVQNLLEAAHRSGFTEIDTAVNYGKSEESIGRFAPVPFNITTKIDVSQSDFLYDRTRSLVLESRDRLGKNYLDTVLLHKPRELLDSKGDEVWWALSDLKHEGLISRIGYSLYYPHELDQLYEDYRPDVVQIPMNVFDVRFSLSGWLTTLRTDGVEVYARSIFLQGLLLQSRTQRNAFFNKWLDRFEYLDSLVEKSSLSKLEYCINFVLQHQLVDKIVVGAESPEQISEIADAATKSVSGLSAVATGTEDENLILPQKWVLE